MNLQTAISLLHWGTPPVANMQTMMREPTVPEVQNTSLSASAPIGGRSCTISAIRRAIRDSFMKLFLVVLEDRQITDRPVSKRNEVIANAAAVSVMRINY
jgi:hypothetical protein